MRTLIQSITRIILLLAFIPGAVAQNPVAPMGEPGGDKTLSPYFFIKSDEPGVDQMPLKETSADVTIAGVIADVVVSQVYENKGTRPIEAVYVFPASTRAAVYAMRMTIGERVIEAKIQEKEEARKNYEEAKAQGRSASLLEQQRPNVFQMNVANIMPGDIIKVELKYTELLVPEKGVYEFVYPTVVGPRYSNTPIADATPSEKWVANPYLTEGSTVPYGFDISTRINAGMAIRDLQCKSHEVNIKFKGMKTADVVLKEPGKDGGNRDYVLQYRLSGGKIETGVLLFPGKDENFFVAMIEGPQAPRPEQIPPREYVFIVDISGSMSGFPLETSKKLMKELLGDLKPTDVFNVMLFAGSSSVMSPTSIPATKENIDKAIAHLSNQRGGGGTELISALQRALALPGTENFARTFVIATDGYVSVEKEAFKLIKNNLGNANFFAFGIGSSVNRYIIEGIAKTGQGEAFVVLNGNEAASKAARFKEYISSPVLSHIEVSFPGFEAYDIQPANLPDVFAERPVMVIGKYRGNPSGNIVLSGIGGEGAYKTSLPLAEASSGAENAALRYLWARQRIADLDDYATTGDPQEAVTALGLKYNLLTQYTSFVAIDSEVRNSEGNPTTVTQPLPLPQGVSNNAVGGAVSYSFSNSAANGRTMKSVQYAPPQNVEVREVVADRIDVGLDLEEETPESEVFMIVETAPAFKDGEAAMMEFFRTNLRYPDMAKQSNITGKVMVEFVVNKDGSVSDVKVIRGVGGGCDEEAIRLVKLTSGKWNPGKQRGRAVRVKMVLPIEFRLK